VLTTEALVADPIIFDIARFTRGAAHVELFTYRIDTWTPDGNTIVEHVAPPRREAPRRFVEVREMIARPCFVCAALAASIVSVSAQTKTPIGTWWSREIQGLENYYTSHAVCGFPLTDEDRKVIVEAYAKINQFSIEDARSELDKSTQRIDEEGPGLVNKNLCKNARDARLKAIDAIRSPAK